MKLDRQLPVYPVLKDQSNWKMFKIILQKINKPTKAGKIALEWQAKQFNSGAENFSLLVQNHQPKVGFEPRPPGSESRTSTNVLTTRLSGPCHLSNNLFCLNNKLYFGLRAIETTQKSRSAWKNHLRSQKYLEEKRKTVQLKVCIKRLTYLQLLLLIREQLKRQSSNTIKSFGL